MRRLAALFLLTSVARPALGQTEEILRAAFEGKNVRVKIEMPGASAGVDLHPGTSRPIDFSQHTGRLKNFGAAYHPGDAAMITKVHVSGDHIEFQLGAGGYGTFGDNTSTSVNTPSVPKTQREKDVETQLKTVTDEQQKRRLRDELDRLRSDREREDARNTARTATAQALKEETLRQRRLAGGSRFNIRYDHDVPPEAMTPQSVMAALADYVDFSGAPVVGVAPPSSGNPNDLKKGMSADDVDALMGRPVSISQRSEGTLTVSTSTYRTKDRKVMAEFVEGVLIRYSVVSQ